MTTSKENQSALLISAMMALAPTIGYWGEAPLQDTLKSILISFFSLSATLLYLWNLRKNNERVYMHAIVVMPVTLMLYALGSMTWSHTFLAGVEAVRWFVFSLILLLGINFNSRTNITHLVWGLHVGAVMAALWTALQFWVDFSFFAQGRTPASTFVNRNFFGEFIVCTFPFSTLLLTKVRDKTSVFLLTFSLAFNFVSLMMAGTRSALVGAVILFFLLPTLIYLYRKQMVSSGWHTKHCIALAILFICTIGILGSIKTTNPILIQESTAPVSALERAIKRTMLMTQSAEYTEGSFSTRAVIWKATWKMVKANPVFGVGAGAWEVHAPLFQEPGNQIETDYYVHNEFFQLIAEYGLMGCICLVGLFAYLLKAAYTTWKDKSEAGQLEAPTRAFTLASLLVFLLVSNAGFPWRMATTGALFALCLSILAASDIRLPIEQRPLFRAWHWGNNKLNYYIAAIGACTLLALVIAQKAIMCEFILCTQSKLHS